MKKLLLSLTILFTVSVLTAQVPLYNGSFENWGAQQPNGWTTALVGNVLIDVFGAQVPMPVNTFFGTQVSDAHAGSTALQLHPANVGVPGTQYNINFPGIAQLGVAGGFNIPLQTILDLVDMISGGDTTGFDPGDFDPSVLASLAQVLAPGDSCSRTPQSINMWVKFSPAGDDEMGVIAYSKSNGQPVGYAEITLDEPINEYTYLSIPFEEAGTPCDSLVVIIMAGTFGTADLGTAMWVDDVTISPYQGCPAIPYLSQPRYRLCACGSGRFRALHLSGARSARPFAARGRIQRRAVFRGCQRPGQWHLYAQDRPEG